jgi:hypothetical protein
VVARVRGLPDWLGDVAKRSLLLGAPVPQASACAPELGLSLNFSSPNERKSRTTPHDEEGMSWTSG